MQKAFVLGAGLGTRLKSLTQTLPKPLIPFYQRPLITFAFDHLLHLGVQEFIVNTHHLADAYAETFPHQNYRDTPIHFRHEPNLLETAGGIANIADLIAEQPCIVYNGDILTDAPLECALSQHAKSDNLVTLVVRSSGDARHIAIDENSGQVTDIRNLMGTGNEGTHLFTGIYTIEPEFVNMLEPGTKRSVIPHFLELIGQEKLGAVVIDEGDWWDLGNRTEYLAAHRCVRNGQFPRYAGESANTWRADVHPTARLDRTATVKGSVVGADVVVSAGADVVDSILWPGSSVAEGASLKNCIVRTGEIASGTHVDEDI